MSSDWYLEHIKNRKHGLVHPCHKIVFSNEKKQTIYIYSQQLGWINRELC